MRRASQVPDPTPDPPALHPSALASAPDVPSAVLVPSRPGTAGPPEQPPHGAPLFAPQAAPRSRPRRLLRTPPDAGLLRRFFWSSPASRPDPFRAGLG